MEQVHNRFIDQFRSHLKGIMLFNALSKLMCILSEGTNIQNGKIQSLHLLQRQIVEDTEARCVTLERPDNLRILGRRSVAYNQSG